MIIPTMISYVLFLLLTTIFLLLLARQHFKNSSDQHNLPPGPSKLPIIGNLHQVIDANGLLHRTFARLSSTYGPIMYLLLGRVPVVVVSSKALARELFTAAGMDLNVSERPKTIALHTLTYGASDVGAARYGEMWRKLRKVSVVGLLNHRMVEGFRRIREESVAQMMSLSHGQYSGVDATSTCGGKGGVVVDVGKLFRYLTGSIMLRLVFGKTYSSDDEKKEGDGRGCKQDHFSRSHHLLDQVEAILGTFFFEDYFPAWGLAQWADAASGCRRRLRRLFDELDAVYEESLQRHEKAALGRDEGGGEEDFVDCIIREQDHSNGITRDNIKAVIADLLIAGTDTTATALSWAMAELMRNPKAMETAQLEVRGIVAGGCGSGDERSRLLVSESVLPRLLYLKAVVKEALRLHMVAPLMIPRETRAACCLGGYSIPAGATIYVNAWAIARDAESWDAPEEFRPERFVGSDVDYSDAGGVARDDFGFLPFGAGRRSCPGARFSAVVIELALANLLCGFDWELPDGVDGLDMAEAPGIAVGIRNGLVLKATRYVQP